MRLAATLLLVAFTTLALPARASSAPASTVRSFFAALERRDFGGALQLTEGAASAVINNMLDGNGATPVDVAYDIDVIGKKWLFHKVARHLSGTASFYVDDHGPRIVAIVGMLEP